MREGGHAHITWKIEAHKCSNVSWKTIIKNAQNLSCEYTANKNKDKHLYCSNINILHNLLMAGKRSQYTTLSLSLTQSSCQITKDSQYPLFPYMDTTSYAYLHHFLYNTHNIASKGMITTDLIYHCVIVLIITCN